MAFIILFQQRNSQLQAIAGRNGGVWAFHFGVTAMGRDGWEERVGVGFREGLVGGGCRPAKDDQEHIEDEECDGDR